jgi:hypothetical protein
VTDEAALDQGALDHALGAIGPLDELAMGA